MNLEKAFFILGIDDSQDITPELIKCHYKKNALRFHPDKNKSIDAPQKFLDITEAYHYLQEHNDYSNYFEYMKTEMFSKNDSNYANTLFSFLENAVGKDIFSNVQTKIFYMIIQRLCNSCESNVFEILKKLDKSIIQKIYGILEMHSEVFHFSEDFLAKLHEMLQCKTQNDECIIIYTFLEDLMQDNLYRLTVNKVRYIIPLWFHELVYDQDGTDIYVQCIPILPENMTLDVNNNLHIRLTYNIVDIFDKDEIVVGRFERAAGFHSPCSLQCSRCSRDSLQP